MIYFTYNMNKSLNSPNTSGLTRMLPMRILSVLLVVALIMPSFLVLPKNTLAQEEETTPPIIVSSSIGNIGTSVENITSTTAIVNGSLTIANDLGDLIDSISFDNSVYANLFYGTDKNKIETDSINGIGTPKNITDNVMGALNYSYSNNISSTLPITFSFYLTDLIPQKTYYYKIVVEISLADGYEAQNYNSNNEKNSIENDSGSAKDFTTRISEAQAEGALIVTTDKAIVSGDNKVTLNGKAVTTIEPKFIKNLKYSFYYSKNPEYIKEKSTSMETINFDDSTSPEQTLTDTLEFNSNDEDTYYYRAVAVINLENGNPPLSEAGEIYSFNLETEESKLFESQADGISNNLVNCKYVSDDTIKGFLDYAYRNKKTQRILRDNRESVRLAINNYNAALLEIKKMEREWKLFNPANGIGFISGFFTNDITSDEFLVSNPVFDEGGMFLKILKAILPDTISKILDGEIIDTSYGLAGVFQSISGLISDTTLIIKIIKGGWQAVHADFSKIIEKKKNSFIASALLIQQYFVKAGVYEAGALAQMAEFNADMAIVGTTSIPGDAESLNKGLDIAEKSLGAIGMFYGLTEAIRILVEKTTTTLLDSIETIGKKIATDVPISSPAIKAATETTMEVQRLLDAVSSETRKAMGKSIDDIEQNTKKQLEEACRKAIADKLAKDQGNQWNKTFFDFMGNGMGGAGFSAIPSRIFIPRNQEIRERLISRFAGQHSYGHDVASVLVEEPVTFSQQTEYTMDQVVPSGNGQDFNNSFEEGGWLAYMEQLKPGNNPLSLQSAINAKINRDSEDLKKSLEEEYQANGGAFSYKECEDPPVWEGKIYGDDPTVDNLCLKWKTLIPGSTLNAMTNTAVTGLWRQLENTDKTGENIMTLQPTLFTEGIFAPFETMKYYFNEKTGKIELKKI